MMICRLTLTSDWQRAICLWLLPFHPPRSFFLIDPSKHVQSQRSIHHTLHSSSDTPKSISALQMSALLLSSVSLFDTEKHRKKYINYPITDQCLSGLRTPCFPPLHLRCRSLSQKGFQTAPGGRWKKKKKLLCVQTMWLLSMMMT